MDCAMQDNQSYVCTTPSSMSKSGGMSVIVTVDQSVTSDSADMDTTSGCTKYTAQLSGVPDCTLLNNSTFQLVAACESKGERSGYWAGVLE